MPLVVGAEPVASIQRAIALLVAASPCALAVATPVTLVAAIGAAARRGILIKGGGVLEALGAVRAVALDKTGTLTVGRPSVTEVKPLSLEWMELLRLTAAVEELSEHPLAQAIVRHARESKLEWPQAKEFTALTGAGASGTVMEKLVAVLKPDAARKLGVKLDAVTERWQHQAEERGHSVVIVTLDKAPAGLIALADTVRPEAKALVAALQRNGVKHIVLLTGDNAGTARAIATEVGIENYHGGLLPEDKVERVQRLHEEYGGVAMVGDGINDAPALAAASVGIAMGAAGSDAAIAAADVALMADDLSKLSDAIALGRRSRRILAQNIAASLLIVGALVAGVFAADLSMFCAVVAHEGTEVLIILNALRALL